MLGSSNLMGGHPMRAFLLCHPMVKGKRARDIEKKDRERLIFITNPLSQL
jgi:hypothetical protein